MHVSVLLPFLPGQQTLGHPQLVQQRLDRVLVADHHPLGAALASWAGTCPGSNESAGRVKSTRTRPGNPYLKGAAGVAAMSAARGHDTYLSAKYRRIASRRGPIKALVAVEHAMLIAIWHMLTNGVAYADPGGDFYTRRNPDKTKNRAIDQLHKMGYAVTLSPLQTALAQ